MNPAEGLGELARAWLAKLRAAGYVPLEAVRAARAEAAIAELVEAGFVQVTDTQVRLLPAAPAGETVGRLNHADAASEADTRRVPRPRSELRRAGLAERTGDALDSTEPGDVRYVVRAEDQRETPEVLPKLVPARCGCGSPWGADAALLAWIYSTGLKPDRLEATCVQGCQGEVALEWPEPVPIEGGAVPGELSVANLERGVRQVGVAALAAILLLGFALGVTLFGLYRQGERYTARETLLLEEIRALRVEREADRRLLEEVDARSRDALSRLEATKEGLGLYVDHVAELRARVESALERTR